MEEHTRINLSNIAEDNKFPLIEGERVFLRLANKSDIPAIIHYYQSNKIHLAPFEPVRSEEFYTVEYWEKELAKNRQAYLDEQSLRLFVFEKKAPTLVIGVVNFNQIFRGAFHACYLGYSLSEDKQGKGLMTEAIKSAIDFVFNQLNLHRIMANYMPHNRKSGFVLKRLGFQVEGYARDYLFINGAWEDHILTSLSNPNWQSE